MELHELLIDLFDRIPSTSTRPSTGSMPTRLDHSARADGANPIGWLVWHLTRVQDDHIADILAAGAGVGTGQLGGRASASPPIRRTLATATPGRTS